MYMRCFEYNTDAVIPSEKAEQSTSAEGQLVHSINFFWENIFNSYTIAILYQSIITQHN
jgi:hypothetical protein